jgi:hypothetical protein
LPTTVPIGDAVNAHVIIDADPIGDFAVSAWSGSIEANPFGGLSVDREFNTILIRRAIAPIPEVVALLIAGAALFAS